jgi:hypothetical protein
MDSTKVEKMAIHFSANWRSLHFAVWASPGLVCHALIIALPVAQASGSCLLPTRPSLRSGRLHDQLYKRILRETKAYADLAVGQFETDSRLHCFRSSAIKLSISVFASGQSACCRCFMKPEGATPFRPFWRVANSSPVCPSYRRRST